MTAVEVVVVGESFHVDRRERVLGRGRSRGFAFVAGEDGGRELRTSTEGPARVGYQGVAILEGVAVPSSSRLTSGDVST